jgi:hypothetical protein
VTVRPLLAIDGDSLAHRAYHALPKSMKSAKGRPSGRARRFRQLPPAAVAGGGAAHGRRRLGHPRGADLPKRSLSLVPERPSLRRRPGRAARPAARARAGARLLRREGGGLRGRRLPGRRGRAGGGARRDDTRRHLGPRRVPARLRADEGSPAGEGRLRAARIGPGGGSRALRRRSRRSADFIALRGDPSDKLPAPRESGRKTASRRRCWTIRLAGGRAGGRSILGASGRNCCSTDESRRWTPCPPPLPRDQEQGGRKASSLRGVVGPLPPRRQGSGPLAAG